MVVIISVVIWGHFGGGDHFDGGDHFGGGTIPVNKEETSSVTNSESHGSAPMGRCLLWKSLVHFTKWMFQGK